MASRPSFILPPPTPPTLNGTPEYHPAHVRQHAVLPRTRVPRARKHGPPCNKTTHQTLTTSREVGHPAPCIRSTAPTSPRTNTQTQHITYPVQKWHFPKKSTLFPAVHSNQQRPGRWAVLPKLDYFLDAAKTAQKSSSPCSVRARLNCSLAADATGNGNPKQSPSAFEDEQRKTRQRGPRAVAHLIGDVDSSLYCNDRCTAPKQRGGNTGDRFTRYNVLETGRKG